MMPFAGLEGFGLASKEQDSNVSERVKSTSTPERSTPNDSGWNQMEIFGESKTSEGPTCSPEGFRAKTFRWREKGRGCPATGLAFGGSLHDSLRIAHLVGSSLKTYQLSLVEGLETYSGSWPLAGTMRNGIVSRQVRLVPITDAIDFGYLPTPTAVEYGTGSGGIKSHLGHKPSLGMMARKNLWPTPKSEPSGPDYARQSRPDSGGDDLATAVARLDPGPLNPTWVEWLMGFPLGWTDLDVSEIP